MMMSFKRAMLVTVAVAPAVVLPVGTAAYAQAAPRAYSIPAQDLGAALQQLATQSGRDIVFSPTLTAGKKSRAVQGTVDAEQALRMMLEGTGLSYATTSQGFAVRSAVGNAPAAAETAASKGEVSDAGLVAAGENTQPAIVVTGTHIRGTAPAGSRLIVLDHADIQRSGYATVQDFLNSVPQNFSGGITTDPTASASNGNAGATINLRGLGIDSTLVLVDGRRQATGGLTGAFVDISSIAASAVERIEILPDGASAIYGSDAVGGVVNVILRKDFKGLEANFRVAEMRGDAREWTGSALAGTSWSSGNFLAGLQEYSRDPIKRTDLAVTSTNDFRPFGGSDFRTVQANPGNIICPSATFGCVPGQVAFAIPSGQNGVGLQPSSLLRGVTNFRDVADPRYYLTPSQNVTSGFIEGRQDLGDVIEAFVDMRYARRRSRSDGLADTRNLSVPKTNPFFVDPFGGQSKITVDYDFISDLGPTISESTTKTFNGTLGFNVKLPSSWRANATGSLGLERVDFSQSNLVNDTALTAALASSNPQIAFNPFGDGSNTSAVTLQSLAFTRRDALSSSVAEGTLSADGPLAKLPGGEIKLAVGVDWRREHIAPRSNKSPTQLTVADTSRDVTAEYAELAIPIVGPEQQIDFVHDLRLSAAVRHETYSDFGSAINPRLGVSWSPLASITFQGSWGTSFKAPRLIDELNTPAANPNNLSFILRVQDPKSSGGFSNALILMGGNPDLKPEKARTWSAGIDFHPTWTPKASAYLNYFSINYDDRIATGGAVPATSTLLQESIWSQVINRNPSAAEVSAICSGPGAFCFGLTPAVIIDARLTNLASLKTSGFDFGGSIGFGLGSASLVARLDGTYVASLRRHDTPTSPVVSLVNTPFNPTRLKMRGNLSFHQSRWTGDVFVNYVSPYRDTLETPEGRVHAWVTTDARISYDLKSRWGPSKIALVATNLFNVAPPFLNTQGLGFDSSNANPYGRVVAIELSADW